MLGDSWLIDSLRGPPEQGCLGPDSSRSAWRGDAAPQDVMEAVGTLNGGLGSGRGSGAVKVFWKVLEESKPFPCPDHFAFYLHAFTRLFPIAAPNTLIPPLWLFIYILGNQYLFTASQYMMGCIILIARVSFLSILHCSTLKAECCQPA